MLNLRHDMKKKIKENTDDLTRRNLNHGLKDA